MGDKNVELFDLVSRVLNLSDEERIATLDLCEGDHETACQYLASMNKEKLREFAGSPIQSPQTLPSTPVDVSQSYQSSFGKVFANNFYTFKYLEELIKIDPRAAFKELIKQLDISLSDAKFILEIEDGDYVAACNYIMCNQRGEIIEKGGYEKSESDYPDMMFNFHHRMAKDWMEAENLAMMKQYKKQEEANRGVFLSIKSILKNWLK